MKKIIVTILIFVFTAATASCVGLFSNENTNNDRYEGGLFSESSSSPGRDSGYGLFRSSDPFDPGDRPGGGGGIGQDKGDAPIGDGIIVLVVCSVLMVTVKVIVKRFKQKPVSQEVEQV